MPVIVGNAIFRYIKHGRPNTQSNLLFLRVTAPFCKVGTITCNRALNAMLPDGVHRSFHITRKTFATSVLRSGASMNNVADVLGHKGTNNIKYYLNLDDKRMKECPVSLAELSLLREGGGMPC